MRRIATTLTALTFAATTSVIGINAAHASEAKLVDRTTTTYTDPVCLEDIKGQPLLTEADCIVTSIIEVTEEPQLQVQALDASVRLASTTRTWNQSLTGRILGIGWTEKHKGKYTFNGHQVRADSHTCGLGGGTLFTVKNLLCDENYGPSRAAVDLEDTFRVSAVTPGGPVSATHCGLFHVSGNGATVGRNFCP